MFVGKIILYIHPNTYIYSKIKLKAPGLANITIIVEYPAVLEESIKDTDQTITDGKKIHKLLTLIRDEISKETRFIIMVKTREVAEMLTTLLKNEGVICAAFTGSSASTDVGGNKNMWSFRSVDIVQ